MNWGEIGRLTLEHLWLVGVSVVIAALVGIPTGIAVTRRPSLRPWVDGLVNSLQTVPSLALFGLLLPLPILGGVGASTAIVALTLYALLPIVRNTAAGILSLDPATVETAHAMGMTPGQVLRLVELPLAARTIAAGLRVATVTTVGTATIAAAIGGGGLGVLIFRGIATVDSTLLLQGSLPAAALALLADGGLGWLERRISRS